MHIHARAKPRTIKRNRVWRNRDSDFERTSERHSCPTSRTLGRRISETFRFRLLPGISTTFKELLRISKNLQSFQIIPHPATPSRPEQRFREPLRRRGGLERPFRAPLRLQGMLEQHFQALGRRPSRPERHFRALGRRPSRPERHFRALGRPERGIRACSSASGSAERPEQRIQAFRSIVHWFRGAWLTRSFMKTPNRLGLRTSI